MKISRKAKKSDQNPRRKPRNKRVNRLWDESEWHLMRCLAINEEVLSIVYLFLKSSSQEDQTEKQENISFICFF
jgi:hypothetical protein